MILVVVLQIAPVMVLLERKWLGRFQSRYGPNRVGYKGALQPLADVFKLLSKEQFHTTSGVAWMMALAPAISVFTAIATRRDHPVRRRRPRRGRPLRHRRLDRHPVGLRVRRARLLRADARRLGVRLQVLVPRRDARRGAADLLRGRARPVADRRGDDDRVAVARPTSSTRRATSGSSSRSSSASASSSSPASRRPTARRSTCPRPTPSSSAATTPSSAGCASARSSWPSTST